MADRQYVIQTTEGPAEWGQASQGLTPGGRRPPDRPDLAAGDAYRGSG